MPRKAKGKKKAAVGRAPRRSREEIEALVAEIDAMVAGGSTIKDALAEKNVSYSNYSYWRKRKGGGKKPRGRTRAAKRGGGKKLSVMAVLEEMTRNRAERAELEDAQRRIERLDARFRELTKQLEKMGG